MKLIYAEKLIQALHDYFSDEDVIAVELDAYWHHKAVEDIINAQPEGVVRCKDCIFYASTKGYSFGVCKYFNRDEDDTDYCNSGERRPDETDIEKASN